MAKIDINNPKIKGLIIESGGNIIQDGEINAHKDSFINLNAKGDYTSTTGKINFVVKEVRHWYTTWWGSSFLGIVCAVIAGTIIYLLGFK
jgi:hypothetical protein